MASSKIIQGIKLARAKSNPFVKLTSIDQISTLEEISREFEKESKEKNSSMAGPIMVWDLMRGYFPLTDSAKPIIADLLSKKLPLYAKGTGTAESALAGAISAFRSIKVSSEKVGVEDLELFPSQSYLIIMNAHRFINSDAVVQAIQNIRTHCKSPQKKKMLILMGLNFNLPPEIMQDFTVVEEELPTQEEFVDLVKKISAYNEFDCPEPIAKKAASALRGLSTFAAETVTVQSFKQVKTNSKISVALDLSKLWGYKKSTIENIPGLKMLKWSWGCNDVGGSAAIINHFTRLFSGRRAPKVLLLFDEIEKMFGGLSGSGDNTGITQDQLGYTLKFMENHGHTGNLAVGASGTGKTYLIQAVASTFEVPILEIDLGSVINSKAGESQARLRALYATIQAMAGDGGCYVYATCNKKEILPPELLRRFKWGTWFFDLPNKEERESVARIQFGKYCIKDCTVDEAVKFFSDKKGWSCADIRNALEAADAYDCSLDEALDIIVPAYIQGRSTIDALRMQAHNTFLSAARPGAYHIPSEEEEESAGRSVSFISEEEIEKIASKADSKE